MMPTMPVREIAQESPKKLRYMSHVQLAAQRVERADKLAFIEHQVACGTLVIRQASAEERERYGISKMPRPSAHAPRRRSAQPGR